MRLHWFVWVAWIGLAAGVTSAESELDELGRAIFEAVQAEPMDCPAVLAEMGPARALLKTSCGRIGKGLRGKGKEVQRLVDEVLPSVVLVDGAGPWAKSGYWRSRLSGVNDRMVTITFLIGVMGELPKGFIYYEYPVLHESCLQVAVDVPRVDSDAEITPAERLPGPPLEYPQLARRLRLEAAVLIEMVIDAEGRVTGACVNRSTHSREGFDFEEAALSYVKQWRYRPTRVNGTPVPTRLTAVIEYRLQ